MHLTRHHVSLAFSALLLVSARNVHPPQKNPAVNTNASLRELAMRARVDFGAAAGPGPLARARRYAALLARNCTVLVAENHMKMKHLQPHHGIFTFSRADTLLLFAQQHAQRMRGHTLIWHFMPPSWLETTSWSRAKLLDILHSHITTVMRHHKGRVYAWTSSTKPSMTTAPCAPRVVQRHRPGVY